MDEGYAENKTTAELKEELMERRSVGQADSSYWIKLILKELRKRRSVVNSTIFKDGMERRVKDGGKIELRQLSKRKQDNKLSWTGTVHVDPDEVNNYKEDNDYIWVRPENMSTYASRMISKDSSPTVFKDGMERRVS